MQKIYGELSQNICMLNCNYNIEKGVFLLNKKNKILIIGVFLIIASVLFLLFRINSRVLSGEYQGTLTNDTAPTYFKFDDDKMYLSTDGDSVMLFDKVLDEKSYDEEVDVRMHMISYRLNKTETNNLKNGSNTSKHNNLFAIVTIFNNEYTDVGFSLNIHSPALKEALLDPLKGGRLSRINNPEFPEIRKKDDTTIKKEEKAAIAKADSEQKLKDKAAAEAKLEAERKAVADAEAKLEAERKATADVEAKLEAERKAAADAEAQKKIQIDLLYSSLVEQKLLPQYSETYSDNLEEAKADMYKYNGYEEAGIVYETQTFSDELIGRKVYIYGYINDLIYLDNEQVWIIDLKVSGKRVFAIAPYTANITNKELAIQGKLTLYGIYKGVQTLTLNSSTVLDVPFFEGRLLN